MSQRWLRRITALDSNHQSSPVPGAEKESTAAPDLLRVPTRGNTRGARGVEDGAEVGFRLERCYFDRTSELVADYEPGFLGNRGKRIGRGATTTIHARDGNLSWVVLSKCGTTRLYGCEIWESKHQGAA